MRGENLARFVPTGKYIFGFSREDQTSFLPWLSSIMPRDMKLPKKEHKADYSNFQEARETYYNGCFVLSLAGSFSQTDKTGTENK